MYLMVATGNLGFHASVSAVLLQDKRMGKGADFETSKQYKEIKIGYDRIEKSRIQ